MPDSELTDLRAQLRAERMGRVAEGLRLRAECEEAYATARRSDEARVRLVEANGRLKSELAAARGALIWCSGSADFGVAGKARAGWLTICAPLLQPTPPAEAQESVDRKAIAEFRAEFPAFALTEKEKSMSEKHKCKVDGCKFKTPEPCCPPAPGSEPGGPSEEEWNGKLPCVPPAPGSEPGGPTEEEWSGRLLIPVATTPAENCRHEEVVDGKCADCGCWVTLTNKAQPTPPAVYACHCDLDPSALPDACVLPDRPSDCIYAEKLLRDGKKREDCDYWRPIPAHPSAPAGGGK